MLSKVKTRVLILTIILSALLWAARPVHAMRRESDPVKPIAQTEAVRVILIGPGW